MTSRPCAKRRPSWFSTTGPWATPQHGFPASRRAEIDLRYAEDMVARLRELDPAPPGGPREPLHRILGCCRDCTLLFVSMPRHHGVPARLVVSPELDVPYLRGLPYARHNLVLDLAALNKHEMILWDLWGVLDDAAEPAPADLFRAEEPAGLIDGADVGQLRVAFEAGDVRVPPVIRSVTPPARLPVEVVLR